MSRAGNEAGFSLLEMLLALSIVALAAYLTFFSGRRTGNSTDLNALAQKTAALLRTARSSALRNGTKHTVSFDLAAREMSFDARKLTFPEDVVLRVQAAASERLSEDELGIAFDPTGRSSGGTIHLARKGVNRTVRVNWLTGSVAVAMEPAR